MKSAAAIAAEATAAQAEAMAASGHRSVFILCVCLYVFFFVSYRMQVWIRRAKWNGQKRRVSQRNQSEMAERRPSILIYLWLIYLFIEYWDLFFLFPPSRLTLSLSLPVKTQTNTRTHFKNIGFRWNHKPESNAPSNKPVQKNVCNIFVEIAGRFVWSHSLGYTAKFIVNVKANRKNVRFRM